MKQKRKKRVLAPDVISGGKAIALGYNYYYMDGKKHEAGGIKVGKNAKTGLEVEGGEVMHLTKDSAKVFSAVPFLDGDSPANKVMKGENPKKVFDKQEDFKDRNKLNDDGTSKNRSSAKLGLGKRIVNYGKTKTIKDYGSIKLDEVKLLDATNPINASDVKISSNIKTTPTSIKENKLEKGIKALSKFLDTNDINSSDLIGLSGNVAGSLISYASNKNTLKKMKAPKQPVAKRSTKLKTKINIQPQLDKMREDVASYTRDVNSNTSSSRTSLARTNRARLASQMNTNELYGAKENAETQLINQDRLNQQQVGNENIEAYNRWNDSVTEHNNKILDAKGENTIGMITGLNSSVQDLLSRREKRRQFNENVKIISAANPNVSDELLESLGVTTVKNARKSNASNNKKGK